MPSFRNLETNQTRSRLRGDDMCAAGTAMCAAATTIALPASELLSQIAHELAPRLRPVGPEMRLRVFQVGEALAGDRVALGVLLHLGGREPVHLRRIQAEDLRAQRRLHLRIAVLL